MASFSIFPGVIGLSGFWATSFNRHYQKTSATSTFIQYELYDSNGLVGAGFGSTFTADSTGILLNVEDTGDSSTPKSFSKNGTFIGSSGYVSTGDSITLWLTTDGTGNAEASFTVPDFGYSPPPSGGGGGTNTEGGGDTSLSFDSNRAMTVTIDSLRDSGTYDIYQDSTLVVQVPHTLGSTTTANSSGPFPNTYEYTIRYNGTVIYYVPAVVNITKVHCNFW